MPRKRGIGNTFCSETCNVEKKVCACGLLSSLASVVEAVGGVFFFFKMLILVLIYHNSNMYNKKSLHPYLHAKVKMQGIIE